MLDHLHSHVAGSIFDHMSKVMTNVNMSFSHIKIIFFLYRNGNKTIKEISNFIGISYLRTFRIVNHLEKYNFIKKTKCINNKNKIIIELNGDGVLELRKMQIKTFESYMKLLSDVPEGLIDSFEELLKEVLWYIPQHPLLNPYEYKGD